MAFGSNTSGFGKREVHRLWMEQRAVDIVSFSRWRGLAAAVALALLGVVAGGAAIPVAARSPQLPDALHLPIAVVFSTIALVASWAAWRILRAVLRPGPALRIDASRIVLRGQSGEVVFTWDDVSLSLGRIFLKVTVSPAGNPSARPAAGREILLPVALLAGGAKRVREAIRRVRPDFFAELASAPR